MAKSDKDWTMVRMGHDQPSYVLQPHMPSIVVGRNRDCNVQCLAKQVSRSHFEFRRIKSKDDDRIYWSIYDLKSGVGTYVNLHRIPPREEIRLNDKDLIALGNYTVDMAAADKSMHVFRIFAPLRWVDECVEDGLSDGTDRTDVSFDDEMETQQFEAAPPPKPDVTIERASSTSDVKVEGDNNSVSQKPSAGESSSEAASPSIFAVKKEASPPGPDDDWSLVLEEDQPLKRKKRKAPPAEVGDAESCCPPKKKLLRLALVDLKPSAGAVGAVVRGGRVVEWKDDGEVECLYNSYTDAEEIVDLDADDYLQQSQVLMMKAAAAEVKSGGSSEDEQSLGGDAEEDVIEISDVDDEDLELSQRPLFQKILSVKKEKESQEIFFPAEASKKDEEQANGAESEDDEFLPLDWSFDDDLSVETAEKIETLPAAAAAKQGPKPVLRFVAGEPLDMILSVESKKKEKEKPRKGIQIIDPLPLPPPRRKSHHHHECAGKRETAEPVEDSPPQSVSVKNFYPLVRLEKFPLPAKELREMRKEKLKELAAKKGGGSKRPVEKTFEQAASTSNRRPSIDSASSRDVAETKKDDYGNRMIAKLTFKNAVTSAPSVWDGSKQPDTRSSKPPAPSDKKKPKGRKSVRWRSQLCEYRYIEKVVAAAPRAAAAASQQAAGAMHSVVRRILDWNSNWLKEQEKTREPPQVEGRDWKVNLVPKVFESYKDYCNSFYPLLLYELWSTVYDDHLSSKQSASPLLISACLVEEKRGEFGSQLSFYGLCTDEEMRVLKSSFTDGWLVKIDLRVCTEEPGRIALKSTLGLTRYCRFHPKRGGGGGEGVHDAILREHSLAQRKHHLRHSVVFGADVKHVHCRLDCAKPVVVTLVSRIKPSLRLFQSVEAAQGSRLFSPLLSPRLQSFYTGSGSDQIAPAISSWPIVRSLNPEQRRVVLTCGRLCTTNPATPQIALVQGPPGTGKSTTLAALVLQVLSKGSGARILVCAPSNAAVDEVLRKLKKVLAEQRSGGKIRMVRIGAERAIHYDVREFQLERLVEGEIEARLRKNCNVGSLRKSQEMSQQHVNNLAQRLDEQLRGGGGQRAMADITDRSLREETRKLNQLRQSLNETLKRNREKFRRDAMLSVMGSADVVLSTLNSSANNQMSSFFLKGGEQHPVRPFTACVIDEASQCIEPESLVPLCLGFNKLVLVGDPEQLPATVKSQVAKKNCLEVSMFSRIYRFFEDSELDGGGRSPVLKLFTQYRMHPAILEWPNRHFYGELLTTCPGLNLSSRFQPYKLLDLRDGEEVCRGKATFNVEEATFVCRLVGFLLEEMKRDDDGPRSLGVITFYSAQRNEISLGLQNLGIKVLEKPEAKTTGSSDGGCVSVRTVDGFQGSECDVVVVSCVKSGGGGGQSNNIGFLADRQRLNVSLTRAKLALYVVGNFEVLCSNPMWKSLGDDAAKRGVVERVRPGSELPQLVLRSAEHSD